MTVLLHRLDEVVKAHECYMADQLARNGVTYWHGRAGLCRRMKCNWKPSTALPRPFSPRPSFWRQDRVPAPFPQAPVDHEHVLDSDSILSMIYLPRSLTVLGWAHCL
ncbi:MAG: hypothetical protein MRJ92_09955 [Nitrospira sp.]|nr:hypothetical protein [Nitrospira sp.]